MVIVSEAGLILMLKLDVTDCAAGKEESVTFTVADVVPTAATEGVPLMTPLEVFKDKPEGRLPPL